MRKQGRPNKAYKPRPEPGGLRLRQRRDPLVPPWLYDWADEYRDGKLPESEDISQRGHYTVGEVLPYLKAGGDYRVLGEMLKANPDLLAHPVVYESMRHLRTAMEKAAEPLCSAAHFRLTRIIEPESGVSICI